MEGGRLSRPRDCRKIVYRSSFMQNTELPAARVDNETSRTAVRRANHYRSLRLQSRNYAIASPFISKLQSVEILLTVLIVNVSALKIHMSESAKSALSAFPEFVTESRGEISIKVTLYTLITEIFVPVVSTAYGTFRSTHCEKKRKTVSK